jgi:hypothetical protein
MSKKNDNLEFAKILAQLIPSVMKNQPTLEPVLSMPKKAIKNMLYRTSPDYRKDAKENTALMTYQRGLEYEPLARNWDRENEVAKEYTYGGSPNDADNTLYPNAYAAYREFVEPRNGSQHGLSAAEMLARAKFSNKRGQ